MNRPALPTDNAALDRMGQQLARMLTQSAAPLSHDVTERLRVARQQALLARKPEAVARPVVQAQGHTLVLSPSDRGGSGPWHWLASAAPLIALVAGLVVVQWTDRENTVSELAEIDTALLVDDLPPSAYSDPGFMQFLRQHAAEPESRD